MKRGFTLVELVMVIIVLGIISSIGAEIISSLYDNYIKSRAINRLETQTDIALEQIAKRFSKRIKSSTSVIRDDGTRHRVENANPNRDHIIEWLGISDESFRGDWNGSAVVAGWSGFVDLSSDTSQIQLRTRGSRLDFSHSIINALSYGTVGLNAASGKKPAIIFKNREPFVMDDFYLNANNANQTLQIQRSPIDNSLFVINPADDSLANDRVYEQYYLSHTAYALVPTYGNPIDRNDFNLTLRYNYQPWEGEAYDDAGTSSSVIAEHVQKLRLQQERGVIRFMLCLRDMDLTTPDSNVTVCKEKVVL